MYGSSKVLRFVKSLDMNYYLAVMLIAFFVVPFFLTLFSCIFKRRSPKLRAIPFAAIIYILLKETVFRRRPSARFNMVLKPFYSYKYLANPYFRELLMINICIFIPIGFAVPWMSRKSFWKTALIGMLISLTIELLQHFRHVGYMETDDVINNTIGTMIGWIYWRILFFIKTRVFSI